MRFRPYDRDLPSELDLAWKKRLSSLLYGKGMQRKRERAFAREGSDLPSELDLAGKKRLSSLLYEHILIHI